MITKIRLHYRNDFAGLARKLRTQILASASTEVGRRWYREMLPKHFEWSATARYGYQPRTERYQKRKAKQKGHQRPLVWTGAMMNALRTAGMLKGYANRAVVDMRGPRWLKGWIAMSGKRSGNKPANYPNKEKEITAITMDEWMELGEVHTNYVRKELEKIQSTRDVVL